MPMKHAIWELPPRYSTCSSRTCCRRIDKKKLLCIKFNYWKNCCNSAQVLYAVTSPQLCNASQTTADLILTCWFYWGHCIHIVYLLLYYVYVERFFDLNAYISIAGRSVHEKERNTVDLVVDSQKCYCRVCRLRRVYSSNSTLGDLYIYIIVKVLWPSFALFRVA